MAKYNQLVRIKDELGDDTIYLWLKAFQNMKFETKTIEDPNIIWAMLNIIGSL